MADKQQLADMLTKRNPLGIQREAVSPVDLYAQEKAPKQESTKTPEQETTIALKHQSTKTLKQVTTKTPNQENRKAGKQVNTEPLKHFSSYLTDSTFKAVKRIAIDTDRRDYEVIQEAVDTYLKARGQKK